MNQKKYHLSHAKHNQEVCEYLKKANKFNDWVITTAFYSALHFVKYELFPNKYDDPHTGKMSNYNTFDEYYRNFSLSGKGKHKVLQELVEEFMPDIADSFQTLKDNCWTARYSDYNYSNEIADECMECLYDIQDYCQPI